MPIFNLYVNICIYIERERQIHNSLATRVFERYCTAFIIFPNTIMIGTLIKFLIEVKQS